LDADKSTDCRRREIEDIFKEFLVD